MIKPIPTPDTHAGPATTGSILLVDDDPGSIQLLGRILVELGEVRFATRGEDALRLAGEAAPDLILLDAEMPGMSGFQVCEALKADPLLADVPVIFVTSHNETAFELAGFELGAVDFIVKPVSPPLVKARVRTQLRLKRMSDQLRLISTIDGLTGVANRRRFDERLECEWSRARRTRNVLALLMIDVDHFKRYNDRYGHLAGDACLRAIAQILDQASQRPADLAARYGGEEFVLLLPDTDEAGAWHVATDILRRVEACAFPHADSPSSECVSVSIGLACASPGTQSCCATPTIDTATKLVHAADLALYAAKRDGRARARAASSPALCAA
ncbi:MAG: diguanylate cyclase [Proteobacteria bacterium]|nr:diguanylate cyclase [Burkholderiales bacterium]